MGWWATGVASLVGGSNIKCPSQRSQLRSPVACGSCCLGQCTPLGYKQAPRPVPPSSPPRCACAPPSYHPPGVHDANDHLLGLIIALRPLLVRLLQDVARPGAALGVGHVCGAKVMMTVHGGGGQQRQGAAGKAGGSRHTLAVQLRPYVSMMHMQATSGVGAVCCTWVQAASRRSLGLIAGKYDRKKSPS